MRTRVCEQSNSFDVLRLCVFVVLFRISFHEDYLSLNLNTYIFWGLMIFNTNCRNTQQSVKLNTNFGRYSFQVIKMNTNVSDKMRIIFSGIMRFRRFNILKQLLYVEQIII